MSSVTVNLNVYTENVSFFSAGNVKMLSQVSKHLNCWCQLHADNDACKIMD